MVLEAFRENYLAAASKNVPLDVCKRIFNQLVSLVEKNQVDPYQFAIYHRAIREPFDYYQFGLDFIKPLINFSESKVLGLPNIDEIVGSLTKGENVILLANHQTEPDPQIINLMLKDKYPHFVSKMIFVAGHRVIEDPLAIPLSMGCNLLCIYSKKHIDFPPEDKAKKISHNQRTMKKMVELLNEGGKCIYVAPSGGRDRPDAQGQIKPAPFDPDSIEMFYLMAQRAKRPTQFYPLSLKTFDIMPPPPQVEKALGERRIANYAPVFLHFGEKIEMEKGLAQDKKERRQQRAQNISFIINQNYNNDKQG